MPCVLNRHHYKSEGLPRTSIYVGRFMLSTLDDHVLDGTALGNPYPVPGGSTDEERSEILERYRAWLWDKLRTKDRAVMEAMRLIDEDSYVVCSCAPKACHADVVVKAWWWLVKEGKLDG